MHKNRLGLRVCPEVTFEVPLVYRRLAGRVGCTPSLTHICYFRLLTCRQWQALIATVAYTSAAVLLSMVTIYHSSYQQENWQQSLVMIAVGMIATLMNTYGAKKLPILEGIVLVVQVVGFCCIIITLWVLSPKATASEVFTSFSNFGGWPNIGTACFVGSITATASFAGSDAAVHMAEETEDASKSVPRMIMITIAVNGLTAFIFIITYVSTSVANTIRLLAGLANYPPVLLHHQHRGCHRIGVAFSVHRRKSLQMFQSFADYTAGIPRINW